MVAHDPTRHVVATTIDHRGAEFAIEEVRQAGFARQIEIKIEDVAQPLPYPDGSFDFVYARLVLHYLPKHALQESLNELRRILKTDGKIFIVVRSIDCPEAHDKSAIVDADTGLTTYPSGGKWHSRFFHSRESIASYLVSAKFSIQHMDSYEEQLCIDFQRTTLSQHIDCLIEVLAIAC